MFLHALHHARSWPVRLIGTAITVHFLLSAALLVHLDWIDVGATISYPNDSTVEDPIGCPWQARRVACPVATGHVGGGYPTYPMLGTRRRELTIRDRVIQTASNYAGTDIWGRI